MRARWLFLSIRTKNSLWTVRKFNVARIFCREHHCAIWIRSFVKISLSIPFCAIFEHCVMCSLERNTRIYDGHVIGSHATRRDASTHQW